MSLESMICMVMILLLLLQLWISFSQQIIREGGFVTSKNDRLVFLIVQAYLECGIRPVACTIQSGFVQPQDLEHPANLSFAREIFSV
jgi:hypothetical protein